MQLAVVDSGPLLASANAADPDHAACVDVLVRPDLELVIPALCVAEVCYFLGQRHGADAEARFIAGLEGYRVIAPVAEDWPLIASAVRRYADLPLGGIDASVAVLADRMGTDRIVTLDRRHFTVLRTDEGRSFDLLPA
ncbi:MAG: PIN domain-containing protein [Gammaproteobacteria bacterium]|nr:PIN domain-containing protein [Gammaproteobacteria bacterium]